MPKGGARPGAGRKKKDTRDRQLANREIVLASVDPEALRGMVLSMVAAAQEGDNKAFSAIAPYLLGAPSQQLEVTGSAGGPIQQEVKHLVDDASAQQLADLLAAGIQARPAPSATRG